MPRDPFKFLVHDFSLAIAALHLDENFMSRVHPMQRQAFKSIRQNCGARRCADYLALFPGIPVEIVKARE